MTEKIITGITPERQSCLFGSFDCNTRLIENQFGVLITSRTDAVKISGENPSDVDKAISAVTLMLKALESGEELSEQKVRYITDMVSTGSEKDLQNLGGEYICVTSRGKPVKAKTLGQKNYVEAIKNNTVTLGIGPAGTGKTFLAVAMAVTALKLKQVNRIILTRPAVEAGERLGFLPGDLQSKIDPYLRPLYDALYEMLGMEGFTKCVENGTIEIAPLAYMRGRTLDDSFIILDEAQNTTSEQMKMFLTRLGFGSKMVVTGDITQIDLPSGTKSGLEQAAKILRDVEGVSVFRLSAHDIVRHALVQRIIRAYENYGKQNAPQNQDGDSEIQKQ